LKRPKTSNWTRLRCLPGLKSRRIARRAVNTSLYSALAFVAGTDVVGEPFSRGTAPSGGRLGTMNA
jgi:hypothetical protein